MTSSTGVQTHTSISFPSRQKVKTWLTCLASRVAVHIVLDHEHSFVNLQTHLVTLRVVMIGCGQFETTQLKLDMWFAGSTLS